MTTPTTLALIGGSGFYELSGFTEVKEHLVDTPYGSTSDAITEFRYENTRVLFLPRHGRQHGLLPSEVPYRANIWALKKLGAVWCLGVAAAGSLQDQIEPGHFVLPDQLIDKTYRREGTFFGGGVVAYPSFAEPYCPVLRSLTVEALSSKTGRPVHPEGTYVCMEGPALSSRAESRLHRSWDAALIGMTACPEVKLAREAELAYATVALVTDYDCWRNDGKDVEVPDILALLGGLTDDVKKALPAIVEAITESTPSEVATNALATAFITDLRSVSEEKRERLSPIIGRYL